MVIAMIFLYSGGLLFFMYYCVMADPETSSIARFLGYTLPDKIWSTLGSACGRRGMAVVEWITDRALILLYIVVVHGSWSVIFAYVYPWIASQHYVSQIHRVIGGVVFAACVFSWRHACTSSPGIITKQTMHLYDHYPYDNYMFEPTLCRTRNIIRPARSKFDRYKYQENVPRYVVHVSFFSRRGFDGLSALCTHTLSCYRVWLGEADSIIFVVRIGDTCRLFDCID